MSDPTRLEYRSGDQAAAIDERTRHRSWRVWIVLCAVWVIGLAVWAAYLAVLAYVVIRALG